jgi:DNA-binding CsgD family transcriptional regulator
LDFKNNYLTQRELDVLDLLRRGKNTQKICKQLGISSKTIEMHVKNIKDKLNCETLFSLGVNLAHLENKGIFL